MKNIDSVKFRKLLVDAEVAVTGMPVKPSLTYYPYGTKIRDLFYSKAMRLAEEKGYQKVILSDFINPSSLTEIDRLSPISKGYMRIKDKAVMMAAGHEVNAYIYIREALKHDMFRLPVRIYNFGSVFRTNKNTKFPFNLGERKSFLECYGVFREREEALHELETAKQWNRTLIKDICHLPCVEVTRPLSTNKKISKHTICIDSLTPLGHTVITGMTYDHDDLFTSALNLTALNAKGKRQVLHSVHFGISENILLSCLLNYCDGDHLRLMNFMAPIQVSILDCTESDMKIDLNPFRTVSQRISRKQIPSCIRKNTLQGIPLTLLNREDGIYPIYRGNRMERLELDKLRETVNHYLVLNDEEIIRDIEQRQAEMIVPCGDLSILAEKVKEGKVARIFLTNTDESVALLESHLSCGEVLGFEDADEEGMSLVNNTLANTYAYVSRRT